MSSTNRNTSPTVSVVIPTYNRADLVTGAVDSALSQTWRDREVIVVDDGSTDGTARVLEPYLDRIRFVPQENRGLAGARNRGILESRGEYLAFLDSDDSFEPGLLEAVLDTFERYPEAGAVFSAEREIDECDGRRERVRTKRSPGPFFTTLGLLTMDTAVGAGRPPVVRRSCVERLGGFDESIRCAVDIEMWLRYSFHVTMVLQPEPLVVRRLHGSNLAGNRKQDAADWLRILDDLAREHPEFVRANHRAFRRVLAKQYVRFGRETLARDWKDRGAVREARQALARACRTDPTLLRPYVYLLWSTVAPSTYHRFRRWELERR